MNDLTAKQVLELTCINEKTKAMGFGTIIQSLIDVTQLSVTPGTPVNAVAATKVLTISGVVVDGETVSIGHDKYEFTADTAKSVTTPGNIPVDIEAYTTKSSGTLTLPTQPTSGDTMTIGAKVYTFVPDGTANGDGEVSIGTNLASAKLALVAAINGSDGHNTPNPKVSAAAFNANNCVVTALVGGVLGNAIGTTETFTAVGNVFAAVTLGTGADCTAANAVTALVAAITAHDTVGVGAVDGAGDTVELTADVKGVIGNAISLAKTMVHGAFAGAAVFLSGGVNGTIAAGWTILADASYLYVATAGNTVADANWRRVSIGSVY